MGAFSFTAILRSHFLFFFLLHLLLLIFNIRWTLVIMTLVIGSIFCISVAFFFSIKSLSNFLFLIKPLSNPTSASSSRNVLSARGLATSLLCGSSNTYSTRSAMFVTGIIRLFQSNCPWGVQKRISWEATKLCSNSEARFSDTARERWLKTSFILDLPIPMHQNGVKWPSITTDTSCFWRCKI